MDTAHIDWDAARKKALENGASYSGNPADFMEAMIRAAGYEPDMVSLASARAYCNQAVDPDLLDPAKKSE